MIKLDETKFVVERPDELPNFSNAKYLYLDFETTALAPNKTAFHPHKGDRICGVAVTADDCPSAYYVPVRHYHKTGEWQPGNVDLAPVQKWLKDIIESCDEWVNANVKFDAHFATAEGAQFKNRLVCLTTAAKVLDSDMTYKGGYGLKNLCEKWLDHKITGLQDKVRGYLDTIKLAHNAKAQDYGLVPIDIMGEYAAEDALSARDIHRYILARMPEDSRRLWEVETLLTPVLYDMELEGMRVDPDELARAEMEILIELVTIEEQLTNILGFPIAPSKPDDCYQLLCAHWGLPVLSYNENGNPSFDKDALVQYLLHPVIHNDPAKTAIVKVMQHYRKRHTLLTFFVKPYQEHNVDSIMRPAYNQAVRSGRMSCKRPNAQQLNKEAKTFIKPGLGRAFLSCDYSQIEFRLIAHYTRAIDAINAYEANPDTDFHTWVAEMCGIPRKPAKNVNFAIGFGAGRKKVTSMLSGNLELMDPEITRDMTPEQFDAYCQHRAEDVYEKYNAALPGLRPTSRAAARNIISRGYVFNAYGRHLHIPDAFAHIAFNRVIQGCAADIMKERTVAVAPRYNSDVRATGLKLNGSVHDETLFVGDVESTRDPKVISMIVNTLEDVHPFLHELRVPIRTSAGWSDVNWAIASGDDGELDRQDMWKPVSCTV